MAETLASNVAVTSDVANGGEVLEVPIANGVGEAGTEVVVCPNRASNILSIN